LVGETQNWVRKEGCGEEMAGLEPQMAQRLAKTCTAFENISVGVFLQHLSKERYAGERPQSWTGLYLEKCEFQSLEISMFSGIKPTALALHIGYTIESFLIHIETLPSACEESSVQYEFQALVLSMFYLYRMDN